MLFRVVKGPKVHARPGTVPAPDAAPAHPTLTGSRAALPHELDESLPSTATAVDPVMAQAKRDIDAGLVETDMHATPGLDAALRAQLVPGPGGKAPGSGA